MSLGKLALGALATTALAGFLHGPMQFGERCAANATPDAAAPAVPDANATATVPIVSATTEEVKSCQAEVNGLLAGKTINFDTSSANIAANSTALVDQIGAALKGCAGVSVEVAGHTDARGNDASNMTLSQARAKSIVDALATRGVAASQMTATGYGETKPLDSSNTPEGDAKNRRIEFNVAAAGGDATANPGG